MTRQFLDFDKLDHCPGCGCGSISVFMQPDISRCNGCRLLFRNPRPTQGQIARSYNTGGTFDVWQQEEESRARMWARRVALIGRFQPGGKLLDVGTGDGRFLRMCRDVGYEVVGTEISEAGAAYARENGFDVKMGQITDVDLAEESFDVVTIWHVLEHVPEPRAVLSKAYSLLRPGGLLAVAVPNEENFFVRRLFGKVKANPFAALEFGGEIHLTHFRPATFHATLRRAEFQVLEFGVDDLYQKRDLRMRLKFSIQSLVAKLFGWHFAVAMYAICTKRARV